MKINIDVTIDDELIQNSADTAARGLFRSPGYSEPKGAPGYERIAEQVKQVVMEMDFTAIARETAAKFARGIVEDVTKETIKRMAREAIKAERDAGTLLPR